MEKKKKPTCCCLKLEKGEQNGRNYNWHFKR